MATYGSKRLLSAALLAAFVLAGPAEGAKPTKPAISVSPTSLAFGDQPVGTTSAAKTLTVKNTGTANLSISKVASSSAAFGAVSKCPSTVAPSATCTIDVTFTPSSAGAASASVTITSNASNSPSLAVPVTGNGTSTTASVRRVEGSGDSIMRGYNASCTSNTGLFDFLCYGGGDQPQNSFLDGSSTAVTSLVDRYIVLDPQVTGGKAASASGSEMTDPTKNNFKTQATAIVSAATQPLRVFVELGGNDICNRATVSALYDDATWEAAVRAGLDVLVNGLPDGSTVLLVSVPRVQDLRAAGIAKQQASGGKVNCTNFWATYGVCPIGTAGGTDLSTRLAAIAERQTAYNNKLVALATEYNGNATTTGVEVAAEFDPNVNTSVGSYSFQASDINGGDCFHPSIQGQNKLSELIWGRNPYR
jgi:lysophospholipase L1-like esterase